MKKIGLLLFASIIIFEAWAQSQIRLGINFPMSNPETANVSIYMKLVSESRAKIARQLTFGDVLWKTVEPTDNSWNFVYSDSVFLNYPSIDYIGNLYCISMKDTLGYQVPWKACKDVANPSCKWLAARDSNDTKEYIQTVIKRYKNTIKYWEIGNEVENNSFPASFPPEQFVQFFKYNYRWIKSSDANAKILIPSFFGTYGLPLQSKYDWLRNFFKLGGGAYIDIIAYHDYNSWWTLPLHIDSIKSIRNSFGFQAKPIWLTESSISSNITSITPSYASIDEQAADVWRRSCLAWSKEVELYNWHSLWSSAPPSTWQEFGLVDNTGKKKKSFHSYKLLAEKIINFTSVNLVSSGIVSDNNTNGGNGVWVIKFIVNGRNNYVMWSPNNQTYSIKPTQNSKFKIQNVVPSSLSTNGETATFQINSILVNAGNSYVFNLTSLPILVEEEDFISKIEQQTLNTIFEISPNPANNFIEIKNNSPVSIKINIFDLSGKIIYFDNIQANESKNISTTGWLDGVYIYEINKTYCGKIILQH